MGTAFNHIGHCVTDLERAKRFYTEVLDFDVEREISPGDELTTRLLRLDPPLGLHACYLRRDGLMLELLHYEHAEIVDRPERVMNEAGLTHLSVSVDDIAATCDAVDAHGGEVLADTDIGAGLFVRDPDGQLIELLPMSYRHGLEP